MVRRLRRIFGIFSAVEVQALAAWYLAAYVMLQYSGLFGPLPEGLMRTLHQWPALAGIAVLMAGSIAALSSMLFAPGKRADSGMRRSFSRLILYFGLLIAGAGIFVSSLMRFEAGLTLIEGYESSTLKEQLDASKLYMRKFSKFPAETLSMAEVSPFIAGDGKPLKRLRAKVLFRDIKNPGGRELRLDSFIPKAISGSFYWVGDAGYAPHYRVFDANGNIVDDAQAILNISPPDREDSFRLFLIPHTFYLRYYPDAAMVPDKTKVPEGKKGPLYRVRVARNLDLIVNTYAAQDDMIQVDALQLSFGEMKRWAEILIVRDPGFYLLLPGLFMMAIGGLVLLFRRITKESIR